MVLADDLDADRRARYSMVEKQIRARGIRDERILDAMMRVARHQFIPDNLRDSAYLDHPLSIGHGQTISQPYIVALMTELIRPTQADRVLEIGTGCGYQTAVLAELVKEVFSIEIVSELASESKRRLHAMGYENVQLRHGDGFGGWPKYAPFQAILVAAAPPQIPAPLVDQLAKGGRMVIPVGRYSQELLLIERTPHGNLLTETITSVAFVPMTGEALGSAK